MLLFTLDRLCPNVNVLVYELVVEIVNRDKVLNMLGPKVYVRRVLSLLPSTPLSFIL